jgi:hypothetical protein
MDKLLRIHKKSIHHRQNVEKCDPPPYLFGIPRTIEQCQRGDTVEILSSSDTTKVVSDISRPTLKPKTFHNAYTNYKSYDKNTDFPYSVEDGSSCFPNSSHTTDNSSSSSTSCTKSVCAETDDIETICFSNWSYTDNPPPYSEFDQFSQKIPNEDTIGQEPYIQCSDEYRRDIVFPCGAWHYSQEFYESCDWCNPKPGSVQQEICNSLISDN